MSEKNRDNKNRWRNVTIAFRMSPEENEELNLRVKLCGYQTKASGVKRIRVHDLRHSHVSLLINMGFTVLAIADRMGHESIDITYRYAHLFPSEQIQMAEQLDIERMEKSNGEESRQ